MTQISKRVLEKQIERKVFESFWILLAKTTNQHDVELFFSDFFTKNEKVNFAKRLSIAILLSDGYEWRSVAETLKVSLDTVGRVAVKMENPGWQFFVKKLKQVEDWQKFWHEVEFNLWRFTGGGRRAFKTNEELEAIIKSRKRK